jgi:cysteinyl-tRNA synthetase
VQINQAKITESDLSVLKSNISKYVSSVLGLEETQTGNSNQTDELIKILITLRKEAKETKNFILSDSIRNQLLNIGIQLKDHKDGTDWQFD